ncbi:hypothetical protein D3C81_2045270 [compost metagenome]
MPGQVLPQPVVEQGLLLAVHVQVVAQRPRHQAVEVAVGQVDTAASGQGQGEADGDEQGFGQAKMHVLFLAEAGQTVDANGGLAVPLHQRSGGALASGVE